jgi:hypothetical protein
MVAAGFGLPAQKKKPVPSMYGPMQSAVGRGFQPGVIAQPNSLQDASLRNGNQEYQAIAPRPNSLADVPASAQAYQQNRQDLFGLNLAANGGIQAQPGPMGPPGSRFPVNRVRPGGATNLPDTPGFDPAARGVNLPDVVGGNPGTGGKTPFAVPVANPISGAGQYANAVAQNGLMNNAQAAGFQSSTGYMPSKTVGGKFGLPAPMEQPFVNRAVNPELGGGKSGYPYNPNYERPAGSPSSGDFFTDNRQGYGPYGPAMTARLSPPKDMTPAKVHGQEDYDRLFGAGNYEYDEKRKAFVPTETYKSQKRNAAPASKPAVPKTTPSNLASTPKAGTNSKSSSGALPLEQRRANVVSNAKERRALRQERIAQKQNPGVANRFFGSQQDLAMQGLRNQGALGVAQENAKGDIARNEAQAALGIAGINARREAEGLKPVGGSTPGEAAPSIPGTEGTPVANNRPVQDAVAEAVKNGDPAAAEAALTGAGVEKNKARQIVQNMAPLPTPTERAWNDLVSQPFSDLGAYALGGFVKPDVPAPARLAPGKLTVDSLQDQEGDNPAQKAARARLRKRYPGVASQGLLPGQK